MDKVCFQCKQPGHLKKDCPEPPYCSNCKTKGHIPVKCCLKNQDKQQLEKRCKSNQWTAEKHKSQGEDWKKAQDQPQFMNPDNRCTGNCRTCDCTTRQQHQVPPIDNPVNGQGIYNSPLHFTHHSPKQQSQQSQLTAGSSTLTLLVANLQNKTFKVRTTDNQPHEYNTSTNK